MSDSENGVVVGLLFQPRGRRPSPDPVGAPDDWTEFPDRRTVFELALVSALLGETSHFGDYFTDDVTFSCPHLVVMSRRAAQWSFGGADDALSDVRVCTDQMDALGDKLFAEWRLEATFSGPLVLDDDILVEPTGRQVQLRGASVAEFRGDRIATFRHYFDDTELLDDVPGVGPHVRFVSACDTPE